MRWSSAFLIFILAVILTGAFVAGLSRTISPLLLQAEQQALVGVLPFIENFLASAGVSDQETLKKLARLSGIDISLLDSSGAVRQSSSSRFISEGRTTIIPVSRNTEFQPISINERQFFLLSRPVSLGENISHIALSKEDELVGPFFDNLFTIAVVLLVFSLACAITTAWYLGYRERTTMAHTNEALTALQKKDYSFRVPAETPAPDAIRESLNQTIAQLSRERADMEREVEKKQLESIAERRVLRVAVNSVSDGVFIIDRLGKVFLFNAVMEKLSGHSGEQIIGKTISDILVFSQPSKPGTLSGAIPQILATGAPEIFPNDTFLKKREGGTVPVFVKTIPVKDELKSDLVYVAVVVREKKEAAASSRGEEKPVPSPRAEKEPEVAPKMPEFVREMPKPMEGVPESPREIPRPAEKASDPAARTLEPAPEAPVLLKKEPPAGPLHRESEPLPMVLANTIPATKKEAATFAPPSELPG